MNLLHKKMLLIMLLLAAPLSAQQTQTTVVPDVEITVNGDTIVVNVEVMSDSVRLARIADAMESLAEAIAECGCMEQQGQTSTVVRVGQGAGILLLSILGLRQLGRIADGLNKEHTPHPEEPESDDDYPDSSLRR